MQCFAIFISIFYLVGFGLLGYGMWALRRSTQAAHWPTTQGALTSIALKEKVESDGSTFEVQVEYSYTVAGQAYRGSRLAFGYAGSSNRESHAEIYEKLKAAKSVDVRYDPDDPAVSSLSYGVHRSIQLLLAGAFTWLAFIVGFTLLWILLLRKDSVLLENLSVR